MLDQEGAKKLSHTGAVGDCDVLFFYADGVLHQAQVTDLDPIIHLAMSLPERF